MLVTMLILALASTLMATGIPVAIDTYHRTVNSANAQVALSTTAAVLRTELGMASSVIEDPAEEGKIYYKGCDGAWASIEKDDENSHGLVKQYYSGSLSAEDGLEKFGTPEPLITDEAITPGLSVTFESLDLVTSESSKEPLYVEFKKLEVKDVQDNSLASIDEYDIMTRFAQ